MNRTIRDKVISFLDFIIPWLIILIPFSIAIAPAPMNVFAGLLVFSFLIKKILKRKKFFVNAAINIPFLVFFIVSVVSVFNSINYQDSIRGLLKLIQYLVLFLIIAEEIKNKEHIRKIVFSMILGASLLSIDAIWQIIWGKDFIRGNLPIVNIGIKRATASFPDANILGIYLSAIFPLVFALALYYFKKNKRLILTLVSILVLSGLTLTYSRPAILAIYVCLLLLGIVKRDKILISVFIILTVIAPFIAPRSIKNWAKEVDYHPIRFMCNDDRIAVYRNTLQMVKAHPVLGVGVNTFMKNYKKYKESPEYRNVITSDYMYAHNNFLHIAGEEGILGLSIFLWLLYKLFRTSISTYNKLKDNFLKHVSLGLILCLFAFLVNGLTESSLYYSRVAMIFWYLVGFSLSLGKFTNVHQSQAG